MIVYDVYDVYGVYDVYVVYVVSDAYNFDIYNYIYMCVCVFVSMYFLPALMQVFVNRVEHANFTKWLSILRRLDIRNVSSKCRQCVIAFALAGKSSNILGICSQARL